MKRISVIPNTDKDKNFEATHKVAQILCALGKEVYIDEELGIKADYIINVKEDELSKTDMIVVLGGDGTILEIAERAAENNTPILGINLGNLGFLTQAEAVSKEIFEDIFNGNYKISENMMLCAMIIEDEKTVGKYTALNDVVIKGETARMVNIKLDIDGTNTNNYPADGVIIATATGSTAYSLSAGGAILHPELDAIMITPICPHTLKARCMIVPDSKTVSVSLKEPYRNCGILTVDGKKNAKISEGAYVKIVKSENKVKFINLNKRTFYDIVREKIADRNY